jgi:peptide/nickel transport system permease protein
MVLFSGLIGATLVRFAPGFGVDERSMDSRFSAHTQAAINREHDRDRNPILYYLRFGTGILQGDFGHSAVYGQPVGRLIRERAPITFEAVAQGLAAGWSAAFLLGMLAALSPRGAVLLPTLAVNGALLSVPSGVLATLCVLAHLPPGLAIGGVILPRAFPHAYEQLRSALGAPHVSMARARGLAPARLFAFHVIPAAVPPLIALVAVSITIAFGASIPIEALADSPGLGQMAWRAALGRDLPVLVSVTLLLTAVAVCANVAADLVMLRGPRAA